MKKVTLVEMAMRDGLQNEKVLVSVEQKIAMALDLIEAGVRRLEVGAFVSPKWVPQMQGTGEVLQQLIKLRDQKKIPQEMIFSVLVPNEEGMIQALDAGADEVAIFAACSESFSKKNINCSIDESFVRFEKVMQLAKKNKIKVRGYLSTCFGCPFEGEVSEGEVIQLVGRMLKLGVYEVSLGDTIGVAHAAQVTRLLTKLKRKTKNFKKIALHFHDTRGQALANIHAGLGQGVRVFDSSAGGLGGCPYAPGALGNVATEDVLYMMDGFGFRSGVKIDKILSLRDSLSKIVNHSVPSRLSQAGKLKPLGKVK